MENPAVEKIDVLDKGYVRLVDHMGTDLSVVNAARASFQKEVSELSERDEKLIAFMAREGHYSVFRHNFVTLEIMAPLEIARQWFKYVVGSAHTDPFSTAWNEACLPGHQVIETNTSSAYRVDELFAMVQSGDSLPTILSSNKDGRVVENSIKDIWETGVQEVYRVTSSKGYEVEATENHRFIIPTGEVELKHLVTGSPIIVSSDNGATEIDLIDSIEYVDRCTTYDIEMEGVPNFIVGGFVVHNSRRYVTMEPEFYLPNEFEWRSAPEDKKQGSAEPLDQRDGQVLTDALEQMQKKGLEAYNMAMDMGVAPEVARLFLPAYGMYTVWRWSTSLQGLAFFLNQRLDEAGAQAEIVQYAKAVHSLTRDLWPISMDALVNYEVG